MLFLKSFIRYIWICFKYVRTYFDTVTLWYFLRWKSYENLIPLQPYRRVSLRLNPLITCRKNFVQLFTSLYFPDMEDKAADIKTIHINPLLVKCTVIPQVRSFRSCKNHKLIRLWFRYEVFSSCFIWMLLFTTTLRLPVMIACWLGHSFICALSVFSTCGHSHSDVGIKTVQTMLCSTFIFLCVWSYHSPKALCHKPMGVSNLCFSATCPIYPSVSGGQSFCRGWTQGDTSSRSEMSLEGIFSPWDEWLLRWD